MRSGMSRVWNKLAEDEVAILHISDLHLGSPKSDDVWKVIKQFLGDREKLRPDLILVTGDLVHTPDRRLYEKAKDYLDNLGVKYRICVGNHDRYAVGNKLARWMRWPWSGASISAEFDGIFAGRILLPNKVDEVDIGTGAGAWNIGLIGLDSCKEADWSARGFVPELMFADLEEATRRKDWDLCICLVHHHVLSIRKLEHKRQANLRNLFNLTCLVNSGSLLEALANAQVDLVLHGHEHESNWATYGTFFPGRSQVRVVGAGSVTGNDSLSGCDLSRATFNVIVLSPNRSGRLRRLAYESNEWTIADDIQLFDSATTRHSRIRRAQDPSQTEIQSEITKYVEFTRERDILVRWVYTNWLPALNFYQEITNSSGVLEDLDVFLIPPNGDPIRPETREPERTADYTYGISWTVPPSLRNQPLTIGMSYRWRGGAVLTEAELQSIIAGRAPGALRKSGFEFSTIWTPVAVAAVELIVTLPPEYAPDPRGIKLIVEEGEVTREEEGLELRRQLRVLAPGVYALRVPYPRTKCYYQIAWPPVAQPAKNVDPELAQIGRRNGDKLISAFGSALKSTSLKTGVTLGLYVRAAGDMTAELVGFTSLGSESNVDPEKPPREVSLAGDRMVLAQAWRGVPTVLYRSDLKPGDLTSATEAGFFRDEEALLGVPIKFAFGWTTPPPPWSVVRLGVRKEESVRSLKDDLWRVLSVATMKMLTVALTEC